MAVVSDLNKDVGGSTDLANERHRSADLHTPIHPTFPNSEERVENVMRAGHF